MHAHKGYRKSPVAQEERAPSDFDTWCLARDPNHAPAGSDAPRRGVGALDHTLHTLVSLSMRAEPSDDFRSHHDVTIWIYVCDAI